MEKTSSLLETYVDYLDDIAEELEYRSNLKVPCKNMSDSSLKKSVTKDAKKICSDYKKNGHKYLANIEELEKLESKIENDVFSENDIKRLLELNNIIISPLKEYFRKFSLEAGSLSRSGYTDATSNRQKAIDHIPTKINKPLSQFIDEKQENFINRNRKIRELISNAEPISNSINENVSIINNTNENKQETQVKKYNTNDKEFLLQYLKDVYELEKERFCSQRAVQEIENRISVLGVPREMEKEYFDFTDALFTTLPFSFFIFVIFGFIFALSSGEFSEGAIKGVISAIIFTIIVILIKLFNCYKKNSGNIMLQKEDSFRIEREQTRIERYMKNQIPYYEIITSCNNTLNKLYGMNIIHPKYRNFLAVSQLYEYIETGRAFTLEGHEGAYNLYENELRQNIIIMQLDKIQEQLEEIKLNQQMIYSAICATNSLLAQIESNTAATAYNTSVIANNTSIYCRY